MFFTALLIFAVLNAVLTNPVPFEPREVDSAGCSPNSDMKELPYNNNNDDIDTNLIRRDPEACKSNPTFPESQPVAPDTSTQPQSAKTPCEGSLKPHYVTCGGFEIMDGWDVDIVTHCVMGKNMFFLGLGEKFSNKLILFQARNPRYLDKASGPKPPGPRDIAVAWPIWRQVSLHRILHN